MNKVSILFLMIFQLQFVSQASEVLTSEELITAYPSISADSERAENKAVLCPFIRMLERAGRFDSEHPENNSDIMVGLIDFTAKAKEFGCGILGCGTVATLVSAGQLTHPSDVYHGKAQIGHINITNLHQARGVAHECGFTFSYGDTEVNDVTRSNTLEKLLAEADPQGRLNQNDIMKVKLDICAEQNVEISSAGEVEAGLIFKYLGGEDRGYVEYEDIVRLFNATMPKTKAMNLL
ncbi:hypothetical protein [Shewanella surugensis]|uniref:EF-hand domain-containing protein n=1 Tax=Shewanella surugensis TaxID=212020 RepID=A0ABT0LJZ7_9GAMM|nr:hypothetical protein [Shewanella surugensis]MCL1128013.1 hypothetical protein [Shewanella surugensis]